MGDWFYKFINYFTKITIFINKWWSTVQGWLESVGSFVKRCMEDVCFLNVERGRGVEKTKEF